jgi:hypothetical protein
VVSTWCRAWCIAVRSFASSKFDYDRMLRGITRPTRSNENVMGALINASSARSGNAKLLADLRRSMPQQDFENISGVLMWCVARRAIRARASRRSTP